MDRTNTKAVALKYDADADVAPVVLAKGEGSLGRAIVEQADESGVPVEQDPVLAVVLQNVQVGQVIPAELYQAAAVIFSRLMAIDSGGVL
jgi:flagellar biosynthesis protein